MDQTKFTGALKLLQRGLSHPLPSPGYCPGKTKYLVVSRTSREDAPLEVDGYRFQRYSTSKCLDLLLKMLDLFLSLCQIKNCF